ncbi:MAG: PASTA domain-containing protein [Candidatus Marinimicrobia bacterium]|nr:PASTA domain-containing protein [Candidatus Neomarinimicrobiota bacterium]
MATVSFNKPRREIRKFDVMPDITGLSLRAALKILGEYNLNAKFSGGGVVLRQNPVAGKSIGAGNLVLLTMENAPE